MENLLELALSGRSEELSACISENCPSSEEITRVMWKILKAKAATLPVIKALLSAGGNPHYTNKKRISALMLVASALSVPLLKYFIDLGANTQAYDSSKNSVLMYAIQPGTGDPKDVVRLLLAFGSDAKFKDSSNSTALHYAALYNYPQTVKLLLDNNAFINFVNKNKDTPIHLAVRHNNVEAASELCQRNCKLNFMNKEGKTPLDEASEEMLAVLTNKNKGDQRWKTKAKWGQKKIKKFDKKCNECMNGEVYCLECVSHMDREEHKELKNMSMLVSNDEVFNELPSNLFKLQQDIASFLKDLEHWYSNVRSAYEKIFNLMKDTVLGCVPTARVQTFGAFATGLMLPSSDMDILIHNDGGDTLNVLAAAIEKLPNVQVMSKHTSVLKVIVKIGRTSVQVAFILFSSKYKSIGLVKKYLGFYKTIRGIYLFLKQLMFFTHFNEPSKGGISSFALFLMVVFFYQENVHTSKDCIENCGDILANILIYYGWKFDYSINIVIDRGNSNMLPFISNRGYGQAINIPDPSYSERNCAFSANLLKFIVRVT